jgi:hypothetical protein
VPIWFVLDGDDFVFNTGAHSIKGRSLAATGSLCCASTTSARPTPS